MGSINRTIGKELSGCSVELSNLTREVVDFEYATGFEGLLCVVRLIDRTLTANLEDSIIEFTGRCKKPGVFDRGSEKVSARGFLKFMYNKSILKPRYKLGRRESLLDSRLLNQTWSDSKRNPSTTVFIRC